MDGSNVRNVRQTWASTLGKACSVVAESGWYLASALQRANLMKRSPGRNKTAARLWASGCHRQQPAANLVWGGKTYDRLCTTTSATTVALLLGATAGGSARLERSVPVASSCLGLLCACLQHSHLRCCRSRLRQCAKLARQLSALHMYAQVSACHESRTAFLV